MRSRRMAWGRGKPRPDNNGIVRLNGVALNLLMYCAVKEDVPLQAAFDAMLTLTEKEYAANNMHAVHFCNDVLGEIRKMREEKS